MTHSIEALEKGEIPNLSASNQNGNILGPNGVESQVQPRSVYSVFSNSQKRCVVFLVAFAASFSTLSSFIYFPAITPLANSLHTTPGKINLSVTTYMIVSAVIPSIVGSAADTSGRRPLFLLTLATYFVANIGIAVQSSFPALLMLRMLQSAGISGTFSVAYGVVSDIASPAERGSFVGIVAFGTNTAPSFGPVLGGLLAAYKGWRWIFWFLSIASGATLVAMIILLPETARKVVGNGSIPATGIHKLPIPRILGLATTPTAVSSVKHKWKLPNPLTCLYTLAHRGTAIIVAVVGILYMTCVCIQASLSSIFISNYHFGELESGLIYLPFGFGCSLAAYFGGRINSSRFSLK